MGRKKGRRQNNKSRDTSSKDSSAGPPLQEEDDDGLPYKVETSEILGRYLAAKRDLTAGEIIMIDEAIAVGPCQESTPLCIGCYVTIDLNDETSYERCEKCGWPLCSRRCPGNQTRLGHNPDECAMMAESTIKGRAVTDFRTCFYALMPLRLLILREAKSKMWEKIKGMEHHSEIRRQNTNLWKMNEELAVEKIRKVLGLSKFTAEDVHFACGVLEVNAFEVFPSPTTQPLRAIYPNASLFSHDCVPNTCHSNGESFSLLVRTTNFIPKNSLLTVSYTYTLQSTTKRRSHLSNTKFFSCCCKRCSDDTEFGLYCSAVKCPKCKIGPVLPVAPLESSSDWVCKSAKCFGYKVSVSAINQLCDRLSAELDTINGNDVMGYENFLKKCEALLHDNHYIRLSALHCLFQTYGKVQGYLINDLSEFQLERKIQICRHLLKIFEKLEPGLSKQRGILLYELQAPLMILLRRRFEERSITKKETKQRLREVNKCLEESWKILSTEWKNSPEGQIAEAAKEALTSTKCWSSIIELM